MGLSRSSQACGLDLVRPFTPSGASDVQACGLTNAGLEGINAVSQGIKKTARGLRDAEHFKTAIYFHCGGLDLYPHETR
jgi:hypothetical protein